MIASENLLQAAKIRRDHRVSVTTEGQDPVAIQVKYDRSCCREYAKNRNLHNLARSPVKKKHDHACDHASDHCL